MDDGLRGKSAYRVALSASGAQKDAHVDLISCFFMVSHGRLADERCHADVAMEFQKLSKWNNVRKRNRGRK